MKTNCILLFICFALGSPLLAREDETALNLTNGFASQKYLGTGKGVIVSVLDAGIAHDTAVGQTPGGSYNGLTVGALGGPDYTRVWKNSNKSVSSDGRTKPDLVAPGENIHVATSDWEKDTDYWPDTGTSFAAPMVGGVAAQVIGYGRAHDMPTDPLLVKAVLLSSARHVKDVNGSGWSWRDG